MLFYSRILVFEIMKRAKITTVIFLLLCIANLTVKADSEGKSDTDTNKYYLHSQEFQLMNEEKQKAIDLWIDFLYNPNDSLRKSFWCPDDVRYLGKNYALFDRSFFQFGLERAEQLAILKPYILYVEPLNDVFFITTLFAKFPLTVSDSSINNQSPWAIIKVAVRKENDKYFLKNVLSYETEFWKKYKYEYLNYLVHPAVEVDTVAMREAKQFIDSLSILWNGEKFDKQIDYYVAPSSSKITDITGYQFAFLGNMTGMVLQDSNTNSILLFTGLSNFIYKHEFVHIVLDEFGNFLWDEGLATFYGGTGAMGGKLDFAQNKKDFFDEFGELTLEKLDEMFEYRWKIYPLGAMVVEQIYKEKGIDGLKQFSQKFKVEDDEEKEFTHHSKQAKIAFKMAAEFLGITETELIEKINKDKP